MNTCPVCAGSHTFDECTSRDLKKCANCGGAHSASYRNCPRYILAKQVTHRVATRHMSYRDALVQIRQEERANTAVISVPDGEVIERQQWQSGELQTVPALVRTDSFSNRSTRAVNTMSIGIQCELEKELTHVSTSTDTVRSADVMKPETLMQNKLHQLLTRFLQLFEDKANQSAMTKSVIDFVSSQLEQPSTASSASKLLEEKTIPRQAGKDQANNVKATVSSCQ